MAGGNGVGANSWVMWEPETTAGVLPGAFTNTLWVTGNPAATSTTNIIRRSYFTGNRAAEVGIRKGKFSANGSFPFPLFPHVGIGLLKHTLGKAILLAQISDTVAAGGITTTGATSTIPLVTGGAYLVGQWITVNTGASQELRRITSYNSGTKTATVFALVTNASAPAATVVVAPAQHRFTQLTSLDANFTTLPTFGAEIGQGGTYAQRYPGCYVSTYGAAGDDNDVSMTVGFTPTADRVRSTPTAFAPTATENADQSLFYTVNHGYVGAFADPAASGTSALQIHKTVTNWNFNIANTMVQPAYWNQTKALGGQPASLRCTYQYTYNNFAKRDVEYEDYIYPDALANAPFYVDLAQQVSANPATPQWYAYGFVVFSSEFVNAPETENIDVMQAITVDAQATRALGTSLCEVFVINSRATVY